MLLRSGEQLIELFRGSASPARSRDEARKAALSESGHGFCHGGDEVAFRGRCPVVPSNDCRGDGTGRLRCTRRHRRSVPPIVFVAPPTFRLSELTSIELPSSSPILSWKRSTSQFDVHSDGLKTARPRRRSVCRRHLPAEIPLQHPAEAPPSAAVNWQRASRAQFPAETDYFGTAGRSVRTQISQSRGRVSARLQRRRAAIAAAAAAKYDTTTRLPAVSLSHLTRHLDSLVCGRRSFSGRLVASAAGEGLPPPLN
jgi:hypothetical protein